MGVYSSAFYGGQVDESIGSAAVVVPAVVDIVRPASVIDIGCGVGGWLRTFGENGVGTLAGEDGPWVKASDLLIDPAHFTPKQLGVSAPPETPRYDLAVSLEVAEHLDAPKADTFVAYLCGHADTILFSAAIPGQGGTHHVNEQQLSYWVEKFGANGFDLFDVLRPVLWNDRRVAWWYRQNIVIFARRGTAAHDMASARLRTTAPAIDLAHPEGFFMKADFKARFWDRPRFTLKRDSSALFRRMFS